MRARGKILDIIKAFNEIPAIIIVLSTDAPRYTIQDLTKRCLEITGTVRENVVGRGMFEAFPGNKEDDNGELNLRKSLDEVLQTKLPHKLNVQRYDVKQKDGSFKEHYWSACNTPVCNDAGEVEYIIHTSEDITDNILGLREAKNTRDNFEYFFQQAIAPFAVLSGEDFIFTFANNAYLQLMNGRPLVGKKLSEAIPELEGQPFVELLKQVYETGIPFNVHEIPATANFEGKELSTRYFNLSYTPYKNADGRIEGVLASGYDITEQVQLKKNENNNILNIQAYNLFMQAPVGFSLVTGEEHRLVIANEKGLQIAGRDASIIGKTVSEILPGIESQGYINLLDSVRKTGKSVTLKESPVTLVRNGKQETIYVDLVYQPYYEGDTIKGVLSISTEVTEQVLGRKESEKMRERFEMMAENIPNLAWLAKPDGWIFWYNSRWYEYTGTGPSDMEGWGWQSVHDAEKLPEVLERWQESIDTCKPFEMVFPLRGADGLFRPFLTRVIPIFDSENNLLWWLGTNTDITKQKELEQMKDDFLSIASHELKTPLTTIKAYGQIIEKTLAESGDLGTLAMVKKMSGQVNRLTSLVEDLLDVSKMQQGKLVYNEAHFDFNALVLDTVDDIKQTTPNHTIELSLEASEHIYGDPSRVSQVLNNLIGNAIKYSPLGKKIHVSTTSEEAGVLLSVQDFGIGIPRAEQLNIFRQFYRVNGDSEPTFTGLGIGLYISAEIVNRMKGKIWVESEVNKGSVFHVFFPKDHRSASEDSSPSKI